MGKGAAERASGNGIALEPGMKARVLRKEVKARSEYQRSDKGRHRAGRAEYFRYVATCQGSKKYIVLFALLFHRIIYYYYFQSFFPNSIFSFVNRKPFPSLGKSVASLRLFVPVLN